MFLWNLTKLDLWKYWIWASVNWSTTTIIKANNRPPVFVLLFISRLWKKCEWASGGAEPPGGDHEGGGEERQTRESTGGATAEGKSWGQRSGEHDPLQRLSVQLDLRHSLTRLH